MMAFPLLTGFRVLGYRLYRMFGWPLPMPISISVYLTMDCNSRCKTCNVWKSPAEGELSPGEWGRVFSSIGKTRGWVTVCGGEPFLYKDFVRTMKQIADNIRPRIVVIPTNGIMTKSIEGCLKKVLEFYKGILVVNFSLDGLGKHHDKIRGISGNFECLIKSIKVVKSLKKEYKNLRLGINTVISRYNIDNVAEIKSYVESVVCPDSHVFEIAENRESLSNMGVSLAPKKNDYIEAARLVSGGDKGVVSFFRKRYYRLVEDVLRSRGRVLHCYAGTGSVEISSAGEVWACCSGCYSMGNLRENGYDFRRVWQSRKAHSVRKVIKEGDCFCTSVNPNYINILCSPRRLVEGIGRRV